MRIELHTIVRGIDDITRLCDNAAAGNVDTVMVPPAYVNDAFTMLKKYKTNILTSVARGDDMVATKIAAIDCAAAGGAKEILVWMCSYDLHDKNWETMEREIYSLFQAAQIHQMQLWIECWFHTLSRSEQARICEMMPAGTGLRMFCPDEEDIILAKMCGVRHIAMEAAASSEMSQKEIDICEDAGATQCGYYEVPQRKTTELHKTEKEL